MNPVLPPRPTLAIGITGHRDRNPVLQANRDGILATLAAVLDMIGAAAARLPGTDEAGVPLRLHSLLADGIDLAAAQMALTHDWQLVVPLPFGPRLNLAINAGATDPVDVRALLAGQTPADPAIAARADAIMTCADRAHLMALADRDATITRLLEATLDAPHDQRAADALAAAVAERAALASRVMIEQSDIVVAVWDGASTVQVGGTGHTVFTALESGAPVVLIEAADPARWRILHAPEALSTPRAGISADREAALADLVRAVVCGDDDAPPPGAYRPGISALDPSDWHPRSAPLWSIYRRIEAVFGSDRPFRSLRVTYESPDGIVTGSAAPMLTAAAALPGGEPGYAARIGNEVMRRFAWADGISAQLSDNYRGGMTLNFLLSALAVIVGISYQPLVPASQKWLFALAEFLFLAAILVVTRQGQQLRWHGRWFETRRVAEYFRHAPSLLVLGVARPPGRWPRGTGTSWPERYALQTLRSLGLPRVTITPAYLRAALSDLVHDHVVRQRDYHRAKARKLTQVHHRLDAIAALSFRLAVLAVTIFLLLTAAGWAGWIDPERVVGTAKAFTWAGVLFPTIGAALSGIRFFGDFERFAAISEVTAEKLDAVDSRITLLLQAEGEALDYARVSELAHTMDEIVIDEIEN